jgi:hypothetical protein
MNKEELLQKIKEGILEYPDFKSEVLKVAESTDFASVSIAIEAAKSLRESHGIELNMDEARRGYIISTAHRFADFVESRIGMCYLRPKEQWLPCIEGNLLEICEHTNKSDLDKIYSYIRRNHPEFKRYVDVFQILEDFKKLHYVSDIECGK